MCFLYSTFPSTNGQHEGNGLQWITTARKSRVSKSGSNRKPYSITGSKRAVDSRFYNPDLNLATENFVELLARESLSLGTREGHNGIGSFVFLSKASSPPLLEVLFRISRGQRVWMDSLESKVSIPFPEKAGGAG